MKFTPIAKNVMLYCRLIYMLSMLYVRLTIKVKVGIPESFKVGWYPHKLTGSSHLNELKYPLKIAFMFLSILKIVKVQVSNYICDCARWSLAAPPPPKKKKKSWECDSFHTKTLFSQYLMYIFYS